MHNSFQLSITLIAVCTFIITFLTFINNINEYISRIDYESIQYKCFYLLFLFFGHLYKSSFCLSKPETFCRLFFFFFYNPIKIIRNSTDTGWRTAPPVARLSSASPHSLARGNWQPTARFPACRPSLPMARALLDLTPTNPDCSRTPRYAPSWPNTRRDDCDASAIPPRSTAATLISLTIPIQERRDSGPVTRIRTPPATRPPSWSPRDSAV